MARARNLKPGFFRDAALVELSVETRLLFAGLWTLADRKGRMEDKPKQIKMELYPADSFDVDAMLTELHDADLITRYEVEGKRFIQVRSFEKHQNPHRDEKESVIPAPLEQDASTVQARCKQDGNPASTSNLTPDSLNPITPAPDKPARFNVSEYLETLQVQKPVADDWLQLRKAKKAAVTKTAIDGIAIEAKKAGISLNSALAESCARGWIGFKAAWMSVKGVEALAVTTPLKTNPCECCGAVGVKRIGQSWYCADHHQYSKRIPA